MFTGTEVASPAFSMIIELMSKLIVPVLKHSRRALVKCTQVGLEVTEYMFPICLSNFLETRSL